MKNVSNNYPQETNVLKLHVQFKVKIVKPTTSLAKV